MPYNLDLKTVVETPMFSARAASVWSEQDHEDFVSHIAGNRLAGAVVPGSGGIRKIRWSREGSGKRGGVRVIYFYQTKSQQIWLLKMYAKNEKENIPAHELKRIKEAIDGQGNE